ncbi:hypothetical protein ABIB75_008200, partial [Bradyrhizobium sp. GM2.2]|uniref:hypothetical protein n=1 Tax=Bradyrhizobium sp. GM2.2 TaxID=3156358 RepID=UPI003396B385
RQPCSPPHLIAITGIRDHHRLEHLITIPGMRTQDGVFEVAPASRRKMAAFDVRGARSHVSQTLS